MDDKETFDAMDALAAIGVATLLMLAVALGFLIFKDHAVTRYYVSAGFGGKGFSVAAEIPWDQDETVYTTDNIANAKQVMQDLNNELRNAPGAVK